MGRIINAKISKDEEVIIEVELDYHEALNLEGNLKNVHIFSEDAAELKTNISQRGANEATKYFLIPKELRKDLKMEGEVRCQKIDLEGKTIFIFVLNHENET